MRSKSDHGDEMIRRLKNLDRCLTEERDTDKKPASKPRKGRGFLRLRTRPRRTTWTHDG